MPTSDFWRDLAVQFRALPDPYGMLRADGHYIIGSGVAWKWELTGGASASLRIQFAALARRGAFQIANADATDLLTVWLEALRLAGCGFEFGERFTETDSGTHHALGGITRLCEASANFCQILESRALQTEFEEKHRDDPQKPTSPKPTIEEKTSRKAFVIPLLDAKGWSILDWANEAEVSHATAIDYLENKTKSYRSTRLKLAKALNVPVEQLPK